MCELFYITAIMTWWNQSSLSLSQFGSAVGKLVLMSACVCVNTLDLEESFGNRMTDNKKWGNTVPMLFEFEGEITFHIFFHEKCEHLSQCDFIMEPKEIHHVSLSPWQGSFSSSYSEKYPRCSISYLTPYFRQVFPVFMCYEAPQISNVWTRNFKI